MKRIQFVILIALAMVSCTKEEVTDSTFDIQARIIQSTQVMVDIIPETNDFYYAWLVIPQSEAAIYTDDSLIQAHHQQLEEIYAFLDSIYQTIPASERVEALPSFEELMLERGACQYWKVNLKPGTPYIIGCYRYSSSLNPMMTLKKTAFTTKEYIPASTTFTFQLYHESATVAPRNPQQRYFCDFQRKDYIDMEYIGMPNYYFYSMVQYYEEYEFFPDALHQDTSKFDLGIAIDFAPGDTIYAMSAGYSNEISDSLTIQAFRYNADSTWSEVIIPSSPRRKWQYPLNKSSQLRSPYLRYGYGNRSRRE